MSSRDSLQLRHYVYAFFSFFSVKKNELKGVAKEVTGKDIVKNLLKYTWPRGRSSEERAVKCSLITSLLLMVASKVRISDKSKMVWTGFGCEIKAWF